MTLNKAIKYTYIFFLSNLAISCNQMKKADLIVFNGKIYTVDSSFTIASAMAIVDEKIEAIGTDCAILAGYTSKNKIDLKGKFVYPGFIDPHSHFTGYAEYLATANLDGTDSYGEMLKRLIEHEKNYPSEWVVGRGWDQNHWKGKAMPTNVELNKAFPNKPVFLVRIDGHAALVNDVALKLAGITTSTKVEGGDITIEKGKPTGVLLDNAIELVQKHIPKIANEKLDGLLKIAEKNCFSVGLTSVADAGIDYEMLKFLEDEYKKNTLSIRVYAMLNPSEENIDSVIHKGPFHTKNLYVSSIKLFADGALGSRGAKLLKPYSDMPNTSGIWTLTKEELNEICELGYEYGFQVNTHCIGDAACHRVLTTYGKYLKGKNDKRWRIEHAQVVALDDISLFGKFSIIPSVQTTHATSDMSWAGDRLGPRIRYAYAYKDLLDQNGWLPNGSDFPIEDINPLYGYYAGVARKSPTHPEKQPFQPENAISSKDALRAMTIWAAKANFMEQYVGSLEVGKFADFVILPTDIIESFSDEIPNTKVTATVVGGKIVFSKL
ncbi:MAG TPA: amidohydrolase [Williamwhitmania sp.]|nr:amidohydrolase [Williamwhitmania sp.]